MRRKDREVTQRAAMLEIMARCDCCRLGFSGSEGAYIVPLNFAFVPHGEQTTLYFHGVREGRKIALTEACPQVGFEMDTSHRLKKGEQACAYSWLYESIIGTGLLSIVEERTEKITALQCLMRKYGGQEPWNFDDDALERVAVLRLDVQTWSCKAHTR